MMKKGKEILKQAPICYTIPKPILHDKIKNKKKGKHCGQTVLSAEEEHF